MLPAAGSAGKEHSMLGPQSLTLDGLIEAFEQHQRRTRGLRDQTLHGYARFVRGLIREAVGNGPIDLKRLGPSDVIRFVRTMTGRFSPRSMKAVGTALRSFLRFLRTEGVCDERLDQMLASFEASTPCARRDRAIVLCLSTLGLRPGEVAALHLEDMDWRRGTVHLRTRKTRRGAVLPLPRDAGRAVSSTTCARS